MQVQRVCLRAVRSTAARQLATEQLDLQLLHDYQGNFILDGKDVGKVAIVRFGPEMRAVDGPDQLRGDPNPLARFAHTPLKDISHSEPPRDARNIVILALECK